MSEWTRWKNVMKAYPFEEKRLAKWQPPYIVQPKYDGVRCRAVPLESGEYMLLSSEENIIFSVPHISREIPHLMRYRAPETRPELDGELYCHGMKFEEIVSVTSRTVTLHQDHKRIQFHCFDVIVEEPQLRRTLMIEDLRGLSQWLVVSPFYLCDSLEDVMRAFDSIVGNGYEGIIVRHNLGPYERKRSTWVMKFKPKQEDSYEIVGFQEEIDKDGFPKDTLGALVCASGDGDIFNVGTGFTDERRRELWHGRDMLKGQAARVKYQHITSGRNVPRFPVFVEVEVKP